MTLRTFRSTVAVASLSLAGTVACARPGEAPPTGPSFAQCIEDCGGGGGSGGAASVRFSAMATGRGNGGNLQVVLLGAVDGLPYLTYQVATSGNWYWRGGPLPNPNSVPFRAVATGVGNDDNLQVIGIGRNDFLPYLIYQVESSGNWYWAGQKPSSIPSGVQFSTVANGAKSFIEYAYGELVMPALRASDGAPFGARQIIEDGSWGSLGELPGGAHLKGLITLQVPGTLYLFGLGTSDGLPYWLHLDECWPGHACWREGALPDPGVPLSALAAEVGNGNNRQLVGLGANDGLPYLLYQGSVSGNWTWAGMLPNPDSVRFRAVAIGKGNGGNLQVVLIGANDGLPYLIYQVQSSGSWYWAGPLPDPNGVQFSSVVASVGSAGNLQVILLGAYDGLPYLIYQRSADGSWHWYGPLPVS